MSLLPPGSRQPALLQTMRMRDPVHYFASLRRRYGPVFRMKLIGFPPQVVVSTAELAAQIYSTDGDGNRAGALRAGYVPWLGDYSLFTAALLGALALSALAGCGEDTKSGSDSKTVTLV
ncbi:hypothetical protein ACWEWX_25095, partial [Streptomyces asiaticus]